VNCATANFYKNVMLYVASLMVIVKLVERGRSFNGMFICGISAETLKLFGAVWAFDPGFDDVFLYYRLEAVLQ